MEKINSDEKILILMKLDGNEIIRVCQTSKDMSQICNSEKYTPLWRKKIQEEFRLTYDGQRGFDKYKELRILYNTNIYSVIITDVTGSDEPRSILFYTLEDAKNYIWMMTEGEFNYMQVENALNVNDYVQIGPYRYMIDINKMNNLEVAMETTLKEQKRSGEDKKQEFYELVRKEAEENEEIDEETIKEGIIDAVGSLNKVIENKTTMPNLFRSLEQHVQNILDENVSKSENFRVLVRNYILDNILINDKERNIIETLITNKK